MRKKSKRENKRGATDGDHEIGSRLRLIRMEREMSQETLGAMLGVSFQQVQKYEKGTNRISSGRLMEIAIRLNTTPHELMGWKDGNAIAAIDIEAYKLAKAFAGLRDDWKQPVRALIGALMRVE